MLSPFFSEKQKEARAKVDNVGTTLFLGRQRGKIFPFIPKPKNDNIK